MIETRVEVRGLRDLSRAFKQVDADLPKELRDEMKAIADHVVGVAQQRMPFRTGTAARSLKPRATQRGAGIAFPGGGDRGKAAYYPWLDFGGTTGRGHVSNGHNGYGGSITRQRIAGGRYLYPAIAESKGYIAEAVDDAVVKVAKGAGFEVRG